MSQSISDVAASDTQTQSGMSRRSRKGCPDCRRRKIKCDERQPKCGQCQKAGRNCRIIDSVFKHHALSFGAGPPDSSQLAGTQNVFDFSGQRERSVQGVDILHATNNEAEVMTNDPHQENPTPLLVHEPDLPRQQSPAHEYYTDVITPPAPAEQRGSGSQPTVPISFSNRDTQQLRRHENFVSDLVTTPNPPTIFSSHSENSAIGPLKDTQEELFFLRHYSEYLAPWMDLLYRYEVFSREVLTLAREHPILRYAACAVAAKQLGQMAVPVATVLQGRTQKTIAQRLTQGRLGFMWYGAKYYEKAIQTLVKQISPKDPQSAQSLPNHLSPTVSLSRGDLMIRAELEDPIVRLLATCILIQYEHLSATRDAWSGHLTGFSKLLDLIDDGGLLQRHPMYEAVYPFTKDVMEVKAAFWNFTVNDMEESYVSGRRTRVDTENLSLWRNMGLVIEDDGSLSLDNTSVNSLSATSEHAGDKILSYTLIWYLCKLIDYLAPTSGVTNLELAGQGTAQFAHLEHQFDAWYQILSISFHPDGTFLTDPDSYQTHSDLFGREIWFSNDLCSTTMMYYHMARMLLLIHRPFELLSGASHKSRVSSFDLLQTYRDIEKELQAHAAKVIATVRGTPCNAVRLRAIQPLYVAGRCCTDTKDRRFLVQMLRDIQDELGIATEYRVKTLLQEWGISYENIDMEARITAEEADEYLPDINE